MIPEPGKSRVPVFAGRRLAGARHEWTSPETTGNNLERAIFRRSSRMMMIAYSPSMVLNAGSW
jgi:hypothetical protein